MNKPFSQSCVENQVVILEQLQQLLKSSRSVLEVGSGTGQHAVFFAKNLPYLHWQTSDQKEYHAGISQWLDEAQLKNISSPIELDVSHSPYPSQKFDAIFSANTCHIMSWKNVQDFIKMAGELINKQGLLIIYGPFNYNKQFTSASNQRFDQWLKSRDPLSGIRDIEAIQQLSQAAGLELLHDIEMPVNNRLICWKKFN